MSTKITTLKFVTVVVLLCLTFVLANTGGVEKISAGRKIGLKSIPYQIGDWKMVDDKESDGLIKKWEFMNEIIIRTYARSNGDVIWLAITYGSDQRDVFAIHMPERCYSAAGFDVETFGETDIFGNGVEIKNLVSRGQRRTEPISYWVILGGKIVTSHWERELKQIYYAIFGKPSYGALIRISSLALKGDLERAYAIQRDFIKQMAQSLSDELRITLFGDMLNSGS